MSMRLVAVASQYIPILSKMCLRLYTQFPEFWSSLSRNRKLVSSPAQRKLGHVVLPSMVHVTLMKCKTVFQFCR